MNKEYEVYYKKFLEAWGVGSQIRMSIEEMSELTKSFCKYQRYKGSDKELEMIESVKEEIADVLNMIDQMQYFFGVEEIEKIRKVKLDRAIKKLA